ncbi:Predicted choline kinase involved in LPS biosynthesis [Richelia intracellularis HH01]|uniref:Predicted choline kinase involved in LPS biosynthesis n=2 Tax=Richelia TaxID=98443 RepID=M1WY54_9NOST|nr:LPS biosynthesis choline kinase [Richelia intracellularis]CCH66682.1 Predicted choline kinase involved in LPS biosynthesis [Richelia intracellularis HH01]
MLFLLSAHNVIHYLQKAKICQMEEINILAHDLTNTGENNKFLVTFSTGEQLLIKQKKYNIDDNNTQDFFNEWLVYQLVQKFPVLANLKVIALLATYFDQENSILVRNYLSDYLELGNFYQQQDIYPESIAAAIGNGIAVIHQSTLEFREYRDFMANAPQGQYRYQFHNPAQGIGIMGTEILSYIPDDAINFYTVYQSQESITAAIADLAYNWHPCCLTHNGLRLENIIVHSRWQQSDDSLIKFIDWKAASWGDPVVDIGCLIASYLNIWLQSLITDNSLEIEESLALALIPLELIKPSIIALIKAYLKQFPAIINYRHDFIYRAIQFSGLVLINRMQEKIFTHKYCSSQNMCALKIANNLLSMPQNSIQTILGVEISELIPDIETPQNIPYAHKGRNLLRIYHPTAKLKGC